MKTKNFLSLATWLSGISYAFAQSCSVPFPEGKNLPVATLIKILQQEISECRAIDWVTDQKKFLVWRQICGGLYESALKLLDYFLTDSELESVSFPLMLQLPKGNVYCISEAVVHGFESGALYLLNLTLHWQYVFVGDKKLPFVVIDHQLGGVLQKMLEMKPEILNLRYMGQSLLQYASHSKNSEIVRLVQATAIQTKNESWLAPLYASAQFLGSCVSEHPFATLMLVSTLFFGIQYFRRDQERRAKLLKVIEAALPENAKTRLTKIEYSKSGYVLEIKCINKLNAEEARRSIYQALCIFYGDSLDRDTSNVDVKPKEGDLVLEIRVPRHTMHLKEKIDDTFKKRPASKNEKFLEIKNTVTKALKQDHLKRWGCFARHSKSPRKLANDVPYFQIITQMLCMISTDLKEVQHFVFGDPMWQRMMAFVQATRLRVNQARVNISEIYQLLRG